METISKGGQSLHFRMHYSFIHSTNKYILSSNQKQIIVKIRYVRCCDSQVYGMG